MTPRRLARGLTLAAHFTLLLSLLAWYGWRFPSPTLGQWLTAIFVLPLLAPLPGLLRGKPYTHAWTSLLSLVYILLGMTEALANPGERSYALAALLASLALFSGCVLYVRFDQRERKSAAS